MMPAEKNRQRQAVTWKNGFSAPRVRSRMQPDFSPEVLAHVQPPMIYEKGFLELPPHIPRSTHRKYPFIPPRQQHPFQKTPPLIVKEIFIPPVLHEFRNDHHDAARRILFRNIKNELHNRNNHEAIRRRQNMQLRWLLARRAERLLHVVIPVFLQQLRMLAGVNVQGNHFRRKPRRKFDSQAGDAAPAVDGNDDNGGLAES